MQCLGGEVDGCKTNFAGKRIQIKDNRYWCRIRVLYLGYCTSSLRQITTVRLFTQLLVLFKGPVPFGPWNRFVDQNDTLRQFSMTRDDNLPGRMRSCPMQVLGSPMTPSSRTGVHWKEMNLPIASFEMQYWRSPETSATKAPESDSAYTLPGTC